jgi:hypothetical protein
MPESPRKRSTPAAKAAKTSDGTVEAKPVKADAAKAETPKAAKATKKATKAAPPAEAAEVLVPGEPAKAVPAKKAAKTAKKVAAVPVEPPAELPATEPGTGEDEPEFLNRAARRAKGRKGGAQQPVFGSGATFAGRGAVPGQRQYGTRRTGG